MDLIEIEKHKLIVNRCDFLLDVLSEEDYSIVNDIRVKSDNILNQYNNKELTVINPSNTEKGLFFSMVKKVIYGEFLNPIIKKYTKYNYHYEFICDDCKIYDNDNKEDWYFDDDKLCVKCKKQYSEMEMNKKEYYDTIDFIRKEFHNKCNTLHFSQDFINKYILLNRKSPTSDYNNRSSLEKVLRETFHTLVKAEFEKQNIELITKYN